MNKKYMDPEMNVTIFATSDVITTSGFDGEEDTDLPNIKYVNKRKKRARKSALFLFKVCRYCAEKICNQKIGKCCV